MINPSSETAADPIAASNSLNLFSHSSDIFPASSNGDRGSFLIFAWIEFTRRFASGKDKFR